MQDSKYSPAASANEQILSSAMFFDCNVNISINKKEWSEVKISEEKDLSCLTSSDAQDVVSAGPLNSCSFANCSVKIKVQYLQ